MFKKNMLRVGGLTSQVKQTFKSSQSLAQTVGPEF